MNTTDDNTWTRTLAGFTATATEKDGITIADHDGAGITADRARILGLLLLHAAEQLDKLTGVAPPFM